MLICPVRELLEAMLTPLTYFAASTQSVAPASFRNSSFNVTTVIGVSKTAILSRAAPRACDVP